MTTKKEVVKLLKKNDASKSTPAVTFNKADSIPLFKGGRPAIGIQEHVNNQFLAP